MFPELTLPRLELSKKEIILDKLMIGMRKVINSNLLMHQRVEIEEFGENLGREIQFKISGFIAAEKLDEYHFKCPEDWWQAFKKRWFPKWAKRRWPIKMREEHISIKALYPELHKKMAFRPDEHICIFKIMEGT